MIFLKIFKNTTNQKYLFKLLCWKNPLPQKLQANRWAPVWSSSCLAAQSCLPNLFGQNLQAYFFTSLWLASCLLTFVKRLKDLLQCLHVKGLAPEWLIIWRSKSLEDWAINSHSINKHGSWRFLFFEWLTIFGEDIFLLLGLFGESTLTKLIEFESLELISSGPPDEMLK